MPLPSVSEPPTGGAARPGRQDDTGWGCPRAAVPLGLPSSLLYRVECGRPICRAHGDAALVPLTEGPLRNSSEASSRHAHVHVCVFTFGHAVALACAPETVRWEANSVGHSASSPPPPSRLHIVTRPPGLRVVHSAGVQLQEAGPSRTWQQAA